ncbi:hypothetical protein ACLMJK_005053 [Lecanora helva]
MVCAKCQKTLKKTELATPGVKRKSDIYYGSNDQKRSTATLGTTGIGKSKLLSKSAKNPYAAYSSSCATCKTKIDQGHMYCHGCAYKKGNGTPSNILIVVPIRMITLFTACSVCGKKDKASSSTGAAVVQGQRFSAK